MTERIHYPIQAPIADAHHHTYGRHIVLSDGHAVEAELHSSHDNKESAELSRFNVGMDLEELRTEYASLSYAEMQELSKAMSATASPFQLHAYERMATDLKGRGLIDPSFSGWLMTATYDFMPMRTPEEAKLRAIKKTEENQRLLNWLQAHKQHMEQRQVAPDFITAVNEQKALWLDTTQRGVQEGWRHPAILERADRQLAGVRAFEGDFFSTSWRELGGYHEQGSSEIVVAKDSVKKHMVHELEHAITDRDEEEVGVELHWVDEALVEHFSDIAKGKATTETIDDRNPIYLEERVLISSLVSLAQGRGIELSMKELLYVQSAPADQKAELSKNIDKKLQAALEGIMDLDKDAPVMKNLQDYINSDEPVSRADRAGATRQLTQVITGSAPLYPGSFFDVIA